MAHPERDTWAIAELLADAGRTEEAIALLEPDEDVVGSVLAWHLIDLGRIKDAVAIFQRLKPIPTKLLQGNDPTDEPPF